MNDSSNRKIICVHGDYELVQNEMIGYIQAEPVPTQEFLDDYYREQYFQKSKPDYAAHQELDREWWELVFRRRLEMLEGHMQGSGRRLLDVGCGPGFFLRTAKSRGWEATGLDPAPNAVEFANSIGVDVQLGIIDKEFVDNATQLFDVIHFHGVLEHVRDPLLMIEMARRILQPGGIVFLSVANDFNPIQTVLWKKCGFDPWWVCPPEHLNYFSPASLKKLVQYLGFTIEYQMSTFPLDLFLLMGDDYVADGNLGRVVHNRRTTMETNLDNAQAWELWDDIYRAFESVGLGRQLELIARR
jgi:SAM-dependent methyltransferase